MSGAHRWAPGLVDPRAKAIERRSDELGGPAGSDDGLYGVGDRDERNDRVCVRSVGGDQLE